MIFARKIYKIPEFYMIFARKMPAFYIHLPEKFFSRILGGTCPPAPPPPPVSYAYVCEIRRSKSRLYLLYANLSIGLFSFVVVVVIVDGDVDSGDGVQSSCATVEFWY